MIRGWDAEADKALGYRPGRIHEPLNQLLDSDTREYVYRG